MTFEDISRLGVYRDQTAIIVKAPEDTKLDLPAPTEVMQSSDGHVSAASVIYKCVCVSLGERSTPAEGSERFHLGDDL